MAILKRKIKLDATIDLGIEIKLPNNIVPLSILTPDGVVSEEAIIEIHEREEDPDLVEIQFSTAIGKIGLIISPENLEKILETVRER